MKHNALILTILSLASLCHAQVGLEWQTQLDLANRAWDAPLAASTDSSGKIGVLESASGTPSLMTIDKQGNLITNFRIDSATYFNSKASLFPNSFYVTVTDAKSYVLTRYLRSGTKAFSASFEKNTFKLYSLMAAEMANDWTGITYTYTYPSNGQNIQYVSVEFRNPQGLNFGGGNDRTLPPGKGYETLAAFGTVLNDFVAVGVTDTYTRITRQKFAESSRIVDIPYRASFAIPLADGSVVVGQNSTSFGQNSTDNRAFIECYDSKNKFLWKRIIPTPNKGGNTLNCKADPRGGLAFTNSMGYPQTARFAGKISNDGSIEWMRPIPVPPLYVTVDPKDLAVASDGTTYVAIYGQKPYGGHPSSGLIAYSPQGDIIKSIVRPQQGYNARPIAIAQATPKGAVVVTDVDSPYDDTDIYSYSVPIDGSTPWSTTNSGPLASYDSLVKATAGPDNGAYVIAKDGQTSLSTAYLLKFSSEGTALWRHDLFTIWQNQLEPKDVCSDSQGNAYVLYTSTYLNSLDLFIGSIIEKVGPDGTSIWKRDFAGQDISRFIFPNKDGSVTAILEHYYYGAISTTVERLAPDGTTKWSKFYDNFGVQTCCQNLNGVSIAGGYRGDTVIHILTIDQDGNSVCDISELRASVLNLAASDDGRVAYSTILQQGTRFKVIGNNGGTIWEKLLPYTKFNGGCFVRWARNGSLYASAIDSTGISGDVVTTCFDGQGNQLWTRWWDSPTGTSDAPGTVYATPDGGLAIVCTSGSDTAVLRYSADGELVYTEGAPTIYRGASILPITSVQSGVGLWTRQDGKLEYAFSTYGDKFMDLGLAVYSK